MNVPCCLTYKFNNPLPKRDVSATDQAFPHTLPCLRSMRESVSGGTRARQKKYDS